MRPFLLLGAVLLLGLLAGCGADAATPTPVPVAATATPVSLPPTATAVPAPPTDTALPPSPVPSPTPPLPTATAQPLPSWGDTVETTDWRLSLAQMDNARQIYYSDKFYYEAHGTYWRIFVDARNLGSSTRSLGETFDWLLLDDSGQYYAESANSDPDGTIGQAAQRAERDALTQKVAANELTHPMLFFDVKAGSNPVALLVQPASERSQVDPTARRFDLSKPQTQQALFLTQTVTAGRVAANKTATAYTKAVAGLPTKKPAQNKLRYDPNGPDRDCGDFTTHAEAQAFFIAAGGPDRDPHRLDNDHDGVACETLP